MPGREHASWCLYLESLEAGDEEEEDSAAGW
jgi:hypothetical protein